MVVDVEVERRTFTLRKPSAWSRVYELSEGDVVVAELRQSSMSRRATAEIGGPTPETWLLSARGVFGTRIPVTRESTGEALAEIRGRQAQILGRAGYRWQRTGWWTGQAFVDSDGRTVATFTRLRGAWHPWSTIETMSGAPHIDLICAVLGSRLLILRRQQSQSSSG